MKIDLKFKITNLKFEKVYIFLSSFLFLFYFVTRLAHLTIIPVFCDEAIYIRWAQVMRAVASLRFLPLSDGKQPFFMWLVIPFLKVFFDPLVAGRMVSVLSGFGSMIGIGVLNYLLFKRKGASLFAMILYLISPFALFFDRMALADGLLSMLGVWCLVFFVLLVRTARLDVAMISGILLGLGLITKSPALFFTLMLPLCLLVKDGCHCEGFISEAILKKVTGKEIASHSLAMTLIRTTVLSGVVYLFAFAIYNILRLGPEFHMIAIRNKDYVFSVSEVLKHPFNPLAGHLKDTVSWYWILLTPVVFLVGIAGVIMAIKSNLKSGIFLLMLVIFPLLGQGAIAKVYTARYVFFTVPFFLIFSAFSVEEFFKRTKNKLIVIGGLVIIFIWPIYQSFLLITNPQRAWLPQNERQGYFEMWTAGYGIKETADYLKTVAKMQKVLVGTEGYFGTLPNSLEMYLEKVPNITIIGVGQPITEISPKLLDGLKENKVFLLVNDSRLKILDDPRLKLVIKYPKALTVVNSQENLLLLEIVE